jgi:hypothetical protein
MPPPFAPATNAVGRSSNLPSLTLIRPLMRPSLSPTDLDVVEGAALRHCDPCDQLTLQTVDEVLEVYEKSGVSEVLMRCLSCEHAAVVLVSRN